MVSLDPTVKEKQAPQLNACMHIGEYLNVTVAEPSTALYKFMCGLPVLMTSGSDRSIARITKKKRYNSKQP